MDQFVSRPSRPFTGLMGLILLGLALLSGLLQAGPREAAPRDVDQGWQYRWGDSPMGEHGVPLWIEDGDDAVWSPIDFPSNPPDREGRENVWFRVTLPEGDWREPVLYIFSVDLIVEVYQDGQRLYRYGEFDADGRGSFIGWPWHMVPLPEQRSDSPLYFRVFSNYQDIGLWGEVKVLERMDLLRYIVGNSLSELIVGAFSLLVALLAAMATVLLSGRRTFAAIALLAASAGGMAIGSCQARLLILNQPLFWDYLAACAYFLTPVAMALLLEQWFAGVAVRLYRGLWLFFTSYLLGALALALSGLVSVNQTYPVFDLLFLLALPLLLAPPLRAFGRVSLEQRAILLAFLLHSLVLLVSMAVAHGLLPWAEVPMSWGALGLSLVIVAISLRHHAATSHALTDLNQTLEAKVAERTAKLEALASQEQGRVQVLEFEREKRGLLEEAITDLQCCQCVDDALEVLAGRFGKFCEPIDGAFYVRDAGGAYRMLAGWGVQLALDPQAGERAIATCKDAQAPRWYIPIGYEQSQQGRRELGMLALQMPAEQSEASRHFDRDMLFCLLNNGIDKINLTLSIVGLQEQLSRFSYEDALTGLKNRRYLDELLGREVALAQRHGTSLSVIVCDIDHFKRFNDAYGHPAGDDALRLVAAQLREVIRSTDIACRYGGEEFVIIMPSADLDACRERAEQLREAVRAVSIEHAGQQLGFVTVSAGIASWPGSVAEPGQLLHEADQALYLAKQKGRDRVEPCPAYPLY